MTYENGTIVSLLCIKYKVPNNETNGGKNVGFQGNFNLRLLLIHRGFNCNWGDFLAIC